MSKPELSLYLGFALLASAVAALILYSPFGRGDTLSRRRSTANSIRRLASQYETNPENKAALKGIIKYANGDYEFGRTYAVVALGNLEGPPKAALPVLIELLQHSDQTTIKEAATVIGRYGPRASEAIPDLIRALDKWEGSDVSWFAAEALGKIGKNTPEVIQALRKAAASEDPRLREHAIDALSELRNANEPSKDG